MCGGYKNRYSPCFQAQNPNTYLAIVQILLYLHASLLLELRSWDLFFFFLILAQGYIYWFYRKKGRGERERDTDVRETDQSATSHAHPIQLTGSLPYIPHPRNQMHNLGVCLDLNWTYDLVVQEMTLHPTKTHGSG